MSLPRSQIRHAIQHEIYRSPSDDRWRFIIGCLEHILRFQNFESNPPMRCLIKHMVEFMSDLEYQVKSEWGDLGNRKYEFLTGVLLNIDESATSNPCEKDILAARVLRFMYDGSLVNEDGRTCNIYTRLRRVPRTYPDRTSSSEENESAYIRISCPHSHTKESNHRTGEHEHKNLQKPENSGKNLPPHSESSYQEHPKRHGKLKEQNGRNLEIVQQANARFVNDRLSSSNSLHRPRTPKSLQPIQGEITGEGIANELDQLAINPGTHRPMSAIRKAKESKRPKEVRFSDTKEERSERGGIYQGLVVENEGKTREWKAELKRQRNLNQKKTETGSRDHSRRERSYSL